MNRKDYFDQMVSDKQFREDYLNSSGFGTGFVITDYDDKHGNILKNSLCDSDIDPTDDEKGWWIGDNGAYYGVIYEIETRLGHIQPLK